MLAPARSCEIGLEPIFKRSEKRLLCHVRPSAVRLEPPHDHDPVLKRKCVIGPRQAGKTEQPDTLDHSRGDALLAHLRYRSLIQHEGAEPAPLLCYDRLRALVPMHLLDPFDSTAVDLLDACKAERCGKENMRIPGLAVRRRDCDEFLARQRIGLIDPGACPARQPEPSALVARLGNALTIGKCQKLSRIAALCLTSDLGKPPDLIGREPRPHQSVPVRIMRGLLAPEHGDPVADIGVPTLGENVAFREQSGDLRRKAALAAGMAHDHHVSEPWVKRQPRQRRAMFGDAALGIDRSQELQQVAGLCHRPRGRPVQEPRLADIGDAPQCEFEQDRCCISVKYFGHVARRERNGLLFGPQPVADTRPKPSSTPAALLRG